MDGLESELSKRIGIRPYRAEDADQLYEAVQESVAEVFPWLPWCRPDYSLEDAREWARTRAELFEQGVEYNFVDLDESARFLGAGGLDDINKVNRYANVGYWVRSSATGRGVATALVAHVATFAFRQTDLVRLEILAATGNLASQRVAEKVGAIREGILHDRLLLHGKLHDAVLFSIVRSKWKPSNSAQERTPAASRPGAAQRQSR